MPITPEGQRLIFLKTHFLPAGFLFLLITLCGNLYLFDEFFPVLGAETDQY